jgi:putative (di)nucleoside polyphosphate hydrolase
MTSGADLSRYRPNVGVALFSSSGHVLIGRRLGERGKHCWQMPQGGIDSGESLAGAALRELAEETGVPASLAEPLGSIRRWLTYDFPPEVRARKRQKGQDWLGQRQRWFAYRFLGSDSDVRLDRHASPEFDAWRWEELGRTPELVIPWKRPVYAAVARAFAKHTSPAGGRA